MVKQFLIIDHSIRDSGGHHYEYALRVLEAAEKAGYQPLLAANRKFDVRSHLPYPVYPVYRLGFWMEARESGLYRLYKTLVCCARGVYIKLKAKIVFSAAGFLWSRRKQPVEFLHSRQYISPAASMLFSVMLFFGIIFRFIYALRLLIPFKGYLREVYAAVKRELTSVRRFFSLLFNPPRWLLEKLAGYRKMKSFEHDTFKLFRSISVNNGDVVFIPTLAEPEMLGLIEFFHRNQGAKKVTWHLLFRRNIFTGRDADYPSQEEALRALRNTFRFFQQNSTRQNVFFYTDTQQLTSQYNRLGTVSFSTLPVPVNTDYYGAIPRGELPLKIIYVGDARTEKGYHHLPRIIGDLPHRYFDEKRIVFELQSVFNTLQGEPAAVIARSQLMHFPAEKVKIILDSLSTDEYRSFLLSGDIVLILYAGERYYARSSGIFIEALMAGKPVIIPAGTWMALQLAASLYNYHLQIKDMAEVLECRSKGELCWRYPELPYNNADQNDELMLSGRDGIKTTIIVPPHSTHLLITYTQHEEAAGEFVEFSLEQFDQTACSICTKKVITGGGVQNSSALFALKDDVLKINLNVKPAYSPYPISIQDLEVNFLALHDDIVPLSTIGAVYSEEREIASCIQHLVDHYEHYSRSARFFSQQVLAAYSPEALVACIDGAITVADGADG